MRSTKEKGMSRRTPRPSVLVVGWLVLALTGPVEGLPGETPPAKATFAGGCFWCMEEAFQDVDGVVSVTSGYTGGRVAKPSYEAVSAGGTGHAEAVEILFDPARITYSRLLEIFWRNIDPTTPDRQFCDQGHQYRSNGPHQPARNTQASLRYQIPNRGPSGRTSRGR